MSDGITAGNRRLGLTSEEIGRLHYRARVTRPESLNACAARYEIDPRDLCDMEHGRKDCAPIAICRHCEYFDVGGSANLAKRGDIEGDCINNHSPHFQTSANRTCDSFYPSTT